MQVRKNTVVSIDYTLTNNEGTVLDTSKGREPLAYLHGNGQIIPGLEQALEGKNSGDTLKVTIPPSQAYGEKNPQLVQTVARKMFGGVADIKPGMQFRGRTEQGEHVVTVVGVEGDNITIDANHPLAGVELTFDVTVVEVRDATEEEIAHGHAHGPDGHGHH
jgi:FKBP-type peptidyl-prolyl cis-trans isomerase SlyD